MSVKLPGLIVAPLTPFADDLSVNKDALLRCVDYVVEDCRASMVISAGVEAQEYQYLDLDARTDLMVSTTEMVDGRCPVAAGVSHPSFKIAVKLAHAAEKAGAAAIQLLAPLRPFGGPATPDEVLRYFEAVSAETSLPIVAYLNAGPGADLSVEATIALARLDRVKYLKESSRDLSRVSRLVVEIETAGHANYFTTMQMLLATLQLGGSGVTLPPPAAFLAQKVIDAYVAGEYAEAARLQTQFALWPSKWMYKGLMPTMKASMKILGHDIGDPYPPFQPLNGKEYQELEAYIKTTDFFPEGQE